MGQMIEFEEIVRRKEHMMELKEVSLEEAREYGLKIEEKVCGFGTLMEVAAKRKEVVLSLNEANQARVNKIEKWIIAAESMVVSNSQVILAEGKIESFKVDNSAVVEIDSLLSKLDSVRLYCINLPMFLKGLLKTFGEYQRRMREYTSLFFTRITQIQKREILMDFNSIFQTLLQEFQGNLRWQTSFQESELREEKQTLQNEIVSIENLLSRKCQSEKKSSLFKAMWTSTEQLLMLNELIKQNEARVNLILLPQVNTQLAEVDKNNKQLQIQKQKSVEVLAEEDELLNEVALVNSRRRDELQNVIDKSQLELYIQLVDATSSDEIKDLISGKSEKDLLNLFQRAQICEEDLTHLFERCEHAATIILSALELSGNGKVFSSKTSDYAIISEELSKELNSIEMKEKEILASTSELKHLVDTIEFNTMDNIACVMKLLSKFRVDYHQVNCDLFSESSKEEESEGQEKQFESGIRNQTVEEDQLNLSPSSSAMKRSPGTPSLRTDIQLYNYEVEVTDLFSLTSTLPEIEQYYISKVDRL